RHAPRAVGLDAEDAGMGVGRADHHRVALSRRRKVVAEAALAFHQPEIFLAADRQPNGSAREIQLTAGGVVHAVLRRSEFRRPQRIANWRPRATPGRIRCNAFADTLVVTRQTALARERLARNIVHGQGGCDTLDAGKIPGLTGPFAGASKIGSNGRD